MFADAGLYIFAGGGIYNFDSAAKPIFFWSPVVVVGRGASTFWTGWRLPQVGEPLLFAFADQRRRIFPHLVIGNCFVTGLYNPAAATSRFPRMVDVAGKRQLIRLLQE